MMLLKMMSRYRPSCVAIQKKRKVVRDADY